MSLKRTPANVQRPSQPYPVCGFLHLMTSYQEYWLACSRHKPADEGKTEGITIPPRSTKPDNIGQNSHEKRLRSRSQQQPGHRKKPLAEFDSPHFASNSLLFEGRLS